MRVCECVDWMEAARSSRDVKKGSKGIRMSSTG